MRLAVLFSRIVAAHCGIAHARNVANGGEIYVQHVPVVFQGHALTVYKMHVCCCCLFTVCM